MIKDIQDQNEGITPNSKQLTALKELFPACFKKDGSFDLARFQTEIADQTQVIQEGYELKFLGKSYAKLLASTDTTTVIEPNEEHNKLPENENSENIYISGDNLDGLKHLLKSYNGQIKCIYIDPPYNTGQDGFVYQDNFNYTSDSLQAKLSISEEEAVRILDLTKRGSASHSAWLMFMYSRLLLARDLLRTEGVIFISIDDNEQANLKLLCDTVFGEENFTGNIIIQTATDNNKTQINTEHEYMYSFCRNKSSQGYWIGKNKPAELIQEKYLELKETHNEKIDLIQLELREWIKKNKKILPKVSHYDNVDKKGVYHDGDIANTKFGGYEYDIIHPITGGICKIPDKGFRFPFDTLKQMIDDEDIVFGEDETTLMKPKKRVENAKDALRSIIYEDGRASSNYVDRLLDRGVFNNPKSHYILKRLFGFVTSNKDIIVDFFSGSGTTSDSVMQLNAEDGGNRKFIAIQIPETLSKEKPSQKAAYKFLEKNNLPTTLDYVGYERIKRAAAKIKAEHSEKELDLGFKHFILQEPNPNTLDKLERFDPNTLLTDKSILDDFGKPTILATWLNADGYGLSASPVVVDLAGYQAYYFRKHLYLIEGDFTLKSMEALLGYYDAQADFNPENLVLFGYSFPDWSINEMIEKNLRILNDGEKNLKINYSVRY
jgi:type III restriction enzyme/adenine-specific DNA-methyltransferase